MVNRCEIHMNFLLRFIEVLLHTFCYIQYMQRMRKHALISFIFFSRTHFHFIMKEMNVQRATVKLRRDAVAVV